VWSRIRRVVTACAPEQATPGIRKHSHVEALPDGIEVKLGVFLSNNKTRRSDVTADKLITLASLGLERAAYGPEDMTVVLSSRSML